MSMLGNGIDAPTRRQGRMSAAVVLGVTLFVGAIPILLPISCTAIGMIQTYAKRSWLLTDVDHLAVRDAGRLLLGKHEKGSFIDVAELPAELAQLGPDMTAYTDDRGFLRLEFGGGFHHHGLFVVPEDAEGITLGIEPPLKFTPLEDGIWFYEET